ncbi:MAG: AmmeMemoRadiSam system protein A [Halarcobacter sp.]
MESWVLLEVAKKSIQEEFEKKVLISKNSLFEKYSEFKELGASFVTLNLDGKLRGCIGSLVAHRNLLDDIIHNAKAAAFADPRFPKLTKKEFENVQVELSILSPAQDLEYKDFEDLKKKIIPNKHGVILELDGKRATFLPQVWEQLNDFDSFMVQLVKKAGLNPSDLSGYPKIQVYEVEKFK